MRPVVFWTNILSPHLSAWIRDVTVLGHGVTVVSETGLTAEREALGWEIPSFGSARVVVGPDEVAIEGVVTESSRDTIHVMAGARWRWLGNRARRACVVHERQMALLTEAPDARGFRGVARRIRYTSERVRFGKHYKFVLGIGSRATRWFRSCGYPAGRIYPFAYVTEAIGAERVTRGSAVAETNASSRRFLVYVGRLVHVKGVDVLLRALAAPKFADFRLHIIGDGPERMRLQGLSQALGIGNQIHWFGAKPSAEARAAMAHAEVTVLPSRHDGWGAVVNESLMAGTPVICTDACGAATLLNQAGFAGTVVPAKNVSALAEALGWWAKRGPLSQSERQRIRAWSNCIQGPALAHYFEQILASVYEGTRRPRAPWLNVAD